MRRRRRILLIVAAVLAVGMAAVVVVARAFVPPWVRGSVERVASEALGRELKIAGDFRLAYSLEPGVVAEGVTLANASWGSEPAMIRAERIEISVDVLSLASPPVRIRNVALHGVRVVLEKDAGGRANWAFDLKPRPPGPKSGKTPVVVDHAAIRDLELVYRKGPEAAPFRFGVGTLEARLDATTNMVRLEAAGYFNDAPWDLAGQLGTLDRLFEVRDVDHDVEGHVGGSRIALRGRIRDPMNLGDPEVDAELEGPDLAAALATIGLKSPLSGPFRARGRFTPADGGIEVDLTAGVAEVTASSRGRLGAILRMDAIDVAVEASGPDASVVGGWFGVEGLPGRPFEIAGRLRRDGPRLSVEDVKGRVGGTALAASGSIGTQPRAVGTDLEFSAKGSDLSELSALARVPLPAGAFTARGRFLRRADALAVEAVELRAQEAVVRGTGTIGEPPRLAGMKLDFDVSGADLSRFSRVAGVELPQAPFELRGNVGRAGEAFAFDGVSGRLGDHGIEAGGRLVPSRRLVGSELDARVVGPDLADAAALFGVTGLAPVSYEVAGGVRIAPDGYHLDRVDAQAGTFSARVAGRIGTRPAEDGVEIEGRVAGRALSDLAAWGVEAALPDDAFEVSGRLRVADRVFRIERGAAEVGDDRATVDGTLGRLHDLSQLDLAVEASGPHLSALGRFVAAGGGEPPRLPGAPYAVSARVRRVPAGLELNEARGTVGDAAIRVDGLLGSGGKLHGTDLRFEGSAPDGAIAAELAGLTLPAGPLAVRGRVERLDSGIRFDGIAASIGETRAELSGVLGDPPDRAGTVLDVVVAGPDLAAVLGPLTGLAGLPGDPFEVSARLDGAAGRIASERFVARLGENDLEGSVAVSLSGRRALEADLRSKHLNLVRVLGGEAEETAPESEPAKKKERLLPDAAIDLGVLESVDAKVRLSATEVTLPGFVLRDVEVEAGVRDGSLRVERAEGSGVFGGRATAQLSLEPVGDGYRLRASGGLAGARLMTRKEAFPPEQAPPVDAEFEVEGTGGSLHAIAASSRGGGLLTLGPGRVPTERGGFVTSGVLRGLLDALNPFRKSSPFTEVECMVVVADLATGKAVVEPVAIRTDRLTVIGRGKVDLDTEAIDFQWTLKPRKGVGISAGSIANPYIKLGGTLSSPSIEAKPLEAAASTGAAVATAGLTLLFRGLYDRITAEKKVCVRAIEVAERQAAERAAAKAREAP